MSPVDLIAWVGAIALAVVMAALAVVIVWAAVQAIRGKSSRKGASTIIGRD